MADFDPPFADSGERRPPTVGEQSDGFPCGPADLQLFNFLAWATQAEIGEVISFFGITPDVDDVTTLRRAIEAGIAAATGGGDTSQFLLTSQARARLPIFPNCFTTDGKMVLSAPVTGTVRVNSGTAIQHRGIMPFTSVQTDLLTDPSKVYHLRADLSGVAPVYSLKDLAAPAYNPTVAAETNAGFDSTYDDMLIARVTTNVSNIATITALVNHPLLTHLETVTGVNTGLSGLNGSTWTITGAARNWARTPTSIFIPHSYGYQQATLPADFDMSLAETVTRYQSSSTLLFDNMFAVTYSVLSQAVSS